MLAWFYDVKNRRKVQRPVRGKMVRMSKGRPVFCFVGDTVDGRTLTVFVSKSDYKKAEVPRVKR